MNPKIMKAITFSYDDGVTQDQRLVDLFNRYNVKATFNLNSALGGTGGIRFQNGATYTHARFLPEEFPRVYRGHEVAAHTLTHPHLIELSDAEILHEIEDDRRALSKIMGYEVVGMAYPFSVNSWDDRVQRLISAHTGVRYARAALSSYSFDLQTDLYAFRPTVHHTEWEKLFRLGEQFIRTERETPGLFTVWGHAYELDMDNSWKLMEDFLKLVSHHEDVLYLTNRQALLEWQKNFQ